MNGKASISALVILSGIIGLVLGYIAGEEDTQYEAIEAKVMRYNPQTGKPEFIKCKDVKK